MSTTKELTALEILVRIQSELKAPKGQFNKFGGYKYRSAEDILEAVKPIATKLGGVVVISDTIETIGNRIYVKATVSLINAKDKTDMVTTSAYAREEESKKGMDGSQVTGASSSYARKYAMNGLFAIDDTKDSDATNTHGKEGAPKVTATQSKYIECWNKFKARNSTASIEQLKEGFKILCMKARGAVDPKTYTDKDWDIVMSTIESDN